MDVQILGLLKAACPDVPITADVVEGSSKLTNGFKGIKRQTLLIFVNFSEDE